MAGLAAGGAAGIQHALAGGQFEQVGGQLRGLVLHADAAFGEARQLAHVAGLGEEDAVAAVGAGAGVDADALQFGEIFVARAVAAVDPQDHRRMGVVRRADRLELLRPGLFQRLLQPARMGQACCRIEVDVGQQPFALALGAAQHGVEQALGPALLQLVGAAHGLADGGVRRDARVEQLVQADQQQRLDVAVAGLERLLQQARGEGGQARLPARRAKGQLLGEATVTRCDLFQLCRQRAAQRGAAGEYGGQRAGGGEAGAGVHWPGSCGPRAC
ncbi:hypothetical protein D3C78_1030770 [compost metagenome]